MIVDDNARLRALLREWLAPEFSEYRILEAASGEEAVNCAGAVPISLAVMDIGLPGMNGIEAARILTTHHSGSGSSSCPSMKRNDIAGKPGMPVCMPIFRNGNFRKTSSGDT